MSDLHDGEIVEMWVEALREVGAYERTERLAEIRRQRYSRRDSQGLYPLSVAWGRVKALQPLEPVLDDPIFYADPLEIRNAIWDDVDAEIDRERVERWRLREQLAKRSVAA